MWNLGKLKRAEPLVLLIFQPLNNKIPHFIYLIYIQDADSLRNRREQIISCDCNNVNINQTLQ